uniref:Uncharacterized protein n=1 Tax=Rhizophora mucronata TaxID=61149 RepID=A0A2P2PZN8_RHIMU
MQYQSYLCITFSGTKQNHRVTKRN